MPTKTVRISVLANTSDSQAQVSKLADKLKSLTKNVIGLDMPEVDEVTERLDGIKERLKSLVDGADIGVKLDDNGANAELDDIKAHLADVSKGADIGVAMPGAPLIKDQLDDIYARLKTVTDGVKDVKIGAAGADESAAALERYDKAAADAVGATDRLNEVIAANGRDSAEYTAALDGATAATIRSMEAQEELAAADARTAGASELSAAKQDESAAVTEKQGGMFAGLSSKMNLAALGIAAIGVVSIKMAGDFDEASTQLVTGAGETEENLEAVKAGMLSISAQTATSTDQITAGMYMIESAGFHGAEGLKVLQAAAMGAKVGNASLASMANAVTSALNAYHLPASQATSITNQLITTVASGKMHMDDLATSLGNVLPIAASAGISLAQVGGAMATMTMQGMSTRRASMNLAATIRSLESPNNVAAGEMQKLGLNANEVSTNLGKMGLTGTIDELTGAVLANTKGGMVMATGFDAMSAPAKALAEQILAGSVSSANLTKDLGKLSPAQAVLVKSFATSADSATGLKQTFDGAMKNMTGGATGLQVALLVGGAHMSTFKSNVDAVADAGKKGGSSVLGWSKIQGDFNFRLEQAKQSVIDMAISFGSALLPVVTAVVKPIAAFGASLLKYSSFGKIVAVLALSFVGLVVAIKLITSATKLWAEAQKILDIAMDLDPAVLIIAGIVALIAIIVILVVKVKVFRDFWIDAWKDIEGVAKDTWHGIEDAAKDVWQKIEAPVKDVWNWIKGNWPLLLGILLGPIGLAVLAMAKYWRQVKEAAVDMWHGVTAPIGAVSHAITGEFDKIKDAITSGFDKWWAQNGETLKTVWKALWDAVRDIFRAAWDVISDVAKTGWKVLTAIFLPEWALITDAVSTGWKVLDAVFGLGLATIKATWSIVWTLLSTEFKLAWIVIETAAKVGWVVLTAVFKIFIAGLTAVWSVFWAVLKAVCTIVWAAISMELKIIWDVIVGIFTVFLDLVTGKWGAAWATVKTVGTQIWNAIKGFLSTIWGAIKDLGVQIFDALQTYYISVWDNIKNAAVTGWDDIKNSLVNAWDTIVSAGKSIWNTFIGWLESAWQGIVRISSSIWDGIETAVEVPVKWVINNIWDPFASTIDAVTHLVGLGKPLPVVHMETGGIVQGSSSRGDNIPIMATAGERILSLPQVARLGGHSSIDAMVGRGSGGPSHYAGGGVAGGKPSGHQGGWFDWLNPVADAKAAFNAVKTGGADLANWAKSLVVGGLTDAIRPVLNAILGQVSRLPGANSGWGKVLAALPKNLAAKLITWLQGEDATASASGSGSAIVNYAKQYIGKLPYVWGGTSLSSGADCSGFTEQIYDHFGYHPPRTSQTQWDWVKKTSTPQVGGLVFFAGSDGTVASPGHVGIIASSNSMIDEYATGHDAEYDSFNSSGGLSGYGIPPSGFATAPAGGATGSEMSNGKELYSYLLSNLFGGSKVAAAGATASIWGESTWNPFAQGTGGRGLIGWTPPSTISSAAFNGGMATQLPAIIQFVSQNDDMGTIQDMKGAKDVSTAAWLWGMGVERFGIPDVHPEGIALATQIMNTLDSGGLLMPGYTMVHNGLSTPEVVTPMTGPFSGNSQGGNVYITVQGDTDPDAAAQRIWERLRTLKRHKGNVSLGF